MEEYRNFSHQLSFDFAKLSILRYSKITKSVVKKFHLEPANEKTKTFDEVFQDFKIGKSLVGLEWDVWSGYSVVAKNESAESLAREIAFYVNENYS